MALPGPIVILLAKSYAHRLTVVNRKTGELYTRAEARDYISKRFGRVTRSQLRGAIHQAERGLQVGQKIQELRASEKLSEALEGERRPAARVGVRVKVTRQFGRKLVKVNDLYLDMSWNDTKIDVGQQVADWVKSTQRGSGKPKSYHWEFAGPTRWPAHYP